MKKPISLLMVAAMFITVGSLLVHAQSATEQKLTQMEKDLWEGWKMHNADAFKKSLSPDFINVSGEGTAGMDETVKGISSSTDCTVNSYSIDNAKFLWVDKNTVVMVYHATQDATCGSNKLPSAVWASSVWSNKDGGWKGVLHQESPAGAGMAAPEKKE